MLRTGDPCPCCGQPIQTTDPELLELLNWIAMERRWPTIRDIRAIRERAKKRGEAE